LAVTKFKNFCPNLDFMGEVLGPRRRGSFSVVPVGTKGGLAWEVYEGKELIRTVGRNFFPPSIQRGEVEGGEFVLGPDRNGAWERVLVVKRPKLVIDPREVFPNLTARTNKGLMMELIPEIFGEEIFPRQVLLIGDKEGIEWAAERVLENGGEFGIVSCFGPNLEGKMRRRGPYVVGGASEEVIEAFFGEGLGQNLTELYKHSPHLGFREPDSYSGWRELGVLEVAVVEHPAGFGQNQANHLVVGIGIINGKTVIEIAPFTRHTRDIDRY
jgi:hypothetical protein